jgi:outer membrane autotransporter protein
MYSKSSKLLKNVLSTASIIALSSGFFSSTSAIAIDRTSQNAISNISTATDWIPNGFISGDSMIFGGNHTINAIGLGSFNVSYVDSGAIAAGTIFIKNSNLYIGGITGNPIVELKMDTGGSATFATLDASPFANIYSGLNIVDFNGIIGSTLTLSNNVPITLLTSFLSTGGDAGKIIINNNSIVTFTGSLSNTPGTLLEGMTINSGAKGRFQFDTTIINIEGQGNFILASDNDKEINSNIGSVSVRINTVVPTMGGNASTTKTTLKSGYSIYANEFKLYGAEEIGNISLDSSIFIMEDNSFIDALITTLPFGPGEFSGGHGVKHSEVDVLSNATIIQDIGTSDIKMNDIKFLGAAGSVVNLSGNLHSDNITLSQPNIILGNDLVFDGQTVADSTTISLGNNTLSFDNASSSEFVGNPTVKFTVDDSKHGRFLVLSGDLDLNVVTSFNITLTDIAAILPPAGPVGQSYLIFEVADTDEPRSIDIVNNAKANFLIAKQNPFVTWSYSNGVVKRVRLPQDQIDDIIEDDVTGGGGSSTTVENAIRLADPNNVGDAAALFQRLTSLLIDGQDLVSALNALQPVIVEASEQISEVVDMALSTIGNRLKSSTIQTFSIAQDDNIQGISAGEDDYAHGVWSSIFWGSATQKARGESPGFKNKTTGYVVGADTKITEDRTIGIAFSYADNNVKHKDTNNGDTSKVKAYTTSIYGVQELNDKWFLQAMGSFSRNKISNREQRFFQNTTEIAKGDFYANAYGLNALAGYNKLITDKLLMITTFGFEYLVLGQSKYKETGTTNQNLTIRKATDHKLDAIIGTSFSHETNFHSYRVVPEVHGNISYDLLNKSPKVTVLLDGLSGNKLVKKTTEQERVFYNLGTSVSTSKGAIELSAGYDLYLSTKYTAHQGAIKVRLNF